MGSRVRDWRGGAATSYLLSNEEASDVLESSGFLHFTSSHPYHTLFLHSSGVSGGSDKNRKLSPLLSQLVSFTAHSRPGFLWGLTNEDGQR